ncbi:MAG: HNH endonuclease [Pseudomonadota bacterium]
MTFENWMRLRGLSESSIKKYGDAISGSLTRWACKNGLVDGPLTAIQSSKRFQSIADQLRSLPEYQETNTRGHNMYHNALNKYAEYLKEGFDANIEDDIDSILERKDISETDKTALLKARTGQASFRQKLFAHWGGCAVTGYQDPMMLVASHIKPWRDSRDDERLDGYNGLLLLPTLDKAFDTGLLSFKDDGKALISPWFQEPERLGISASMRVAMQPKHQEYMKFHREWVFRGA